MKLLFIHNDYYRTSGEEHAVESLAKLLQIYGHDIIWYRRSSTELDHIFLGKLRAPFLSIFNPRAVKDIKKIIIEQKPDLVQVQNLYPIISPRILKTAKLLGIPIVMRCPNYRLFCPTGLFYDASGNICEKCTDSGHELWCLLKNCMSDINKSTAYALRNFISRTTNVFSKYVDVFIVQSNFQRDKFIELGIPAKRIAILPGLVPELEATKTEKDAKYILFVGRLSREKGIDDFIEAARCLPSLKFVVAGEVPANFFSEHKPENIDFLGFVKGRELDELFWMARMIIVPSRWYEGFPNVIVRAMTHAIPIITTNFGCFPEIIGQECGLTYTPGDVASLVNLIIKVISNRQMSEKMGIEGRKKAMKEYSSEAIYNRLLDIYSTAGQIQAQIK